MTIAYFFNLNSCNGNPFGLNEFKYSSKYSSNTCFSSFSALSMLLYNVSLPGSIFKTLLFKSLTSTVFGATIAILAILFQSLSIITFPKISSAKSPLLITSSGNTNWSVSIFRFPEPISNKSIAELQCTKIKANNSPNFQGISKLLASSNAFFHSSSLIKPLAKHASAKFSNPHSL
uniref:Uncharacterized protein n=1 Tax=Meloidogyne incognita TaxID=6306 RepID=A0A914L5U2_MELIC